MRSAGIREEFLRYFESKGHRRIHSSPLIPHNDPTLLFTNAGMVQFKDVLLGSEKRDYKRAVTSQKCIRAGGKHNDLENVGRTARHHTFFEMLGNFSFGDYFKEGAIEYGWEFMTDVMGLPEDKLWVSIYKDDDDAEEIWIQKIGFPADRIVRLGDLEKGDEENFWSMGDTGPCGPCSEILMDRGVEFGCGKPDCRVGCDCDRYYELWNLVFMQYTRDESGKLTALPKPSIDTGLGLERTSAVMQNANSVFDTDLFRSIISAIEEITGKEYIAGNGSVPFRVIADHIRALTFAITDAVLPSNEGRGYVLRRILRRAARFGRMLDMHEPFIYRLVSTTVDLMGGAYPEIVEKAQHVSLVVKSEEENFSRTLDRGINRFEEIVGRLKEEGKTRISGADIFRLYDTYGFPPDLTQLMAEEKELSIDLAGFDREMHYQRERVKSASRFRAEDEGNWISVSDKESSKFIGYDELQAEAEAIRYRVDGDKVDLILDLTSFYAEAGGQIGDSGVIKNEDITIQIDDTLPQGGEIVHKGHLIEGDIEAIKKQLTAQVDSGHRLSTARNHTATHLLHRALRQVLGEHVHQSGSLVAPDRLRFDFTHFTGLDPDQIRHIEAVVNGKIREDIQLQDSYRPLDEAKSMGAMALFGEKYDTVVRVVEIGDFSMELCGGTHVRRTGELGLFRIVSEGGIAAGVRRIEALSGGEAEHLTHQQNRILSEIEHLLNVPTEEVAARVQKLIETNRALEREIQRIKGRYAVSEVDELVENAIDIDNRKIVSSKVESRDMDSFRKMADSLRDKLKSGVGVIGMISNGKVSLLAVVTDDLIESVGLKAGDLVKDIAVIVGGAGGGKPHLAQAGGRDPEKLDEALGKVAQIVQERLEQ